MPELPELRVMANTINKSSKGQLFTHIVKSEVNKNMPIESPFKLFKLRAESRGKEICVILSSVSAKGKNQDGEELSILFTMGMSGDWVWCETTKMPKHSHLQFHSEQGTHALCFVDPRRFGRWSIGTFSSIRSPDPTLEYDLFCKNIVNSFQHKDFDKPICEILLNQKYFNGIGNYLRAEILDRLSVPPFMKARDALHDTVMQLAEEHGIEIPAAPINSRSKKKVKENNDQSVISISSKGTTPTMNILTLCRDIPLEVLALKDDSKAGFEEWLQCYGKLKKTTDGTGRTIWYRKDLGKVESPEKKKSKSTKSKRPLKDENGIALSPVTPLTKRRKRIN